MALEESTEVGLGREFDVGRSLFDVVAIEGVEDTLLSEGSDLFIRELQALADEVVDMLGNFGIAAGKGEVIDLANEEDLFAKEFSVVNVFSMSGTLETKIIEDGSDVKFPEAACFRVALESMVNRESMIVGNVDVESIFVPFAECGIQTQEGGCSWCRRMCIGIFGISTIDDVVLGSRQSHK